MAEETDRELMVFNKYQTELTPEILEEYPQEVIDELFEYINTVPFIQNLVSVDRRYAKDMPKDNEDKIIVDLINPHILEDMDYFMETANHWREHGCYTKLKVNINPHSEWMKWFKRELDRCWNGMVRPSDGEWITGDLYFFLNYTPMIQTVIRYTNNGSKYGTRIETLPEIWEGIYWRFHYLYQARYGGLYNDFQGGKHGAEIASRGKGKAHPYSQDVFTPQGWRKWGDIKIGDKLYGDDGLETTVVDIPFDEETDIYKVTLRDGREVYSSLGHLFKIYIDKYELYSVKSLEEIKNISNSYFYNLSIPTLNRDFKTNKEIKNIPIHSIEFSHKEKAKCVTVDNKSSLYLIGDFVITHNSYSLAALLSKLFVIGIGEGELSEKRKALIVADLKTYLIEDGTLNKFEDSLDHLAKYTEFPRHRERESLNNMYWLCGWTDENGDPKGAQNLVIGQAIGDDSDKSRGKRSDIMLGEEFGSFGKFSEWWATSMPNVQEAEIVFGLGYVLGTGGCVCKGTKVYDREGYITNIENINQETGILGYNNGSSQEDVTWVQGEAYKECVEIICENNITLRCSVDHPILSSKPNYYMKKRKIKKIKFQKAGLLKEGEEVMVNNKLNISGYKTMKDAELIGLLIGDGNYSTKKANITLSILGEELYNYIDKNYNFRISKILTIADNKIYSQIYFYSGLKKQLKELGILYQKGENKTLPKRINDFTLKSTSQLLRGLFEADGDVKITKSGAIIRLTAKNINLLEEVKVQLLRFGINSSIRVEQKGGSTLRSNCNNTEHYINSYDCGVLYISHQYYVEKFREKIGFITTEKQSKLERVKVHRKQNIYDDCRFIKGKNKRGHILEDKVNTNLESVRIKKIKNIGIQRIYNLTANNTNTYLCENIVTHNTEGSDFSGALDMIYSPDSNHIYGLPNVYDKGSNAKKNTIFFFPAFINYKPYYNKDGVSDVIGAMLSELQERYNIKYNSEDPLKLTRRKAEFAFTLQDAIMRRDSTLYPVADINDRIMQLDNDITYMDSMYIGKVELSGEGATWKPDSNVNIITRFPHKDNKLEGGLLIKTMPVRDSKGRVPRGRYIAGGDFYDDDSSNTLSLGSMFVLDLWTDDIVAEYTGRPMFADDLYENVRRVLLLYNAELNYENNKKGIYAYFSRHNCLYLLSDNLDFLRDKDNPRIHYGNTSKGTANYSNSRKGGVAAYARRCYRDYLLKPYEYSEIERDEDNNDVEVFKTIPNLYRIVFRALLQETALWNMDGNFDRHDAMMMLMLLREDKLRLNGDGDFESRYNDNDADYLGNDDFFKKFDKKHGYLMGEEGALVRESIKQL